MRALGTALAAGLALAAIPGPALATTVGCTWDVGTPENRRASR